MVPDDFGDDCGSFHWREGWSLAAVDGDGRNTDRRGMPRECVDAVMCER
jgi:hypothetical protein